VVVSGNISDDPPSPGRPQDGGPPPEPNMGKVLEKAAVSILGRRRASPS
jgi:hypothetical protein